MFAKMEISNLYNQYLQALIKIYDKGEATAITHLVFKEKGYFTKGRLPDKNIDLAREETDDLLGILDKLKKHVPVQYALGYTWFHNLKFKVTPATLIPRPETEELVLQAIQFLKPREKPMLIDIVCGSRCIPVSIKNKFPNTIADAIDISENALNIARENALLNKVAINFYCIDFLNRKENDFTEKYDCIISNPPYIPKRQISNMDKNVSLNEPHIALFVPDDNPLIFYESIAEFAQGHLLNSGKGFVEVHENFATETLDLFKAKKFLAEPVKDIFGKNRFVHFTHCL